MGRVEYTKEELQELNCPDPENQPNQIEKDQFEEGDRLPTDLVCDDTEKRIVGGQEAIKMSWPWMVQITYYGFPSCGGTIISDNAILTAAHCCEHYDKLRFLKGLVGQHTTVGQQEFWWLPDLDEGAKSVSIKRKIIHPLWNRLGDNDICILFTESEYGLNS